MEAPRHKTRWTSQGHKDHPPPCKVAISWRNQGMRAQRTRPLEPLKASLTSFSSSAKVVSAAAAASASATAASATALTSAVSSAPSFFSYSAKSASKFGGESSCFLIAFDSATHLRTSCEGT